MTERAGSPPSPRELLLFAIAESFLHRLQLTKTTGDAILLTQLCVDALAPRPPGLIDRGFHGLKGKSAVVQVFGLNQETDAQG
jgi:hypothetical protein